MDLRIINLGSSSAGNCTYCEFGRTRILIDAGLSAKQIELRLLEANIDIRTITDVLITHEHKDHTQAVSVLTKKYPEINFFANYATGKAAGYIANFRVFETGKYFYAGPHDSRTVIVQPLAVPHNAAEPVGFRVFFGERAMIYLTDLGHVSDELIEHIVDSEIVLLESNYERDLLVNSDRPFETDARNYGRTGHLSNCEAALAIMRAKNLALDLQREWRPVLCLLHLSRSFNNAALVQSAFAPTGLDCLVAQENQLTYVI